MYSEVDNINLKLKYYHFLPPLFPTIMIVSFIEFLSYSKELLVISLILTTVLKIFPYFINQGSVTYIQPVSYRVGIHICLCLAPNPDLFLYKSSAGVQSYMNVAKLPKEHILFIRRTVISYLAYQRCTEAQHLSSQKSHKGNWIYFRRRKGSSSSDMKGQLLFSYAGSG